MKIVRHIPNSITLCNLLCGTMSSLAALEGNYSAAFGFMVASAVFDFCDGLSARLLKAYSPMGKELDSLADMISFGLAPTLIVYNFVRGIVAPQLLMASEAGEPTYLYTLLLAAPFTLVALSALRLAKFNIDTRQSHNFIGLATPSAALMLAGFMAFVTKEGCILEQNIESAVWLDIVTVAIAQLLVCNIPMFSFKFSSLGWKGNERRFVFIAIALLIALGFAVAGLFSFPLWIAATLLAYIVINIALAPFTNIE